MKVTIYAEVMKNDAPLKLRDWELTPDRRLHHLPSGCVFQEDGDAMCLAHVEGGKMPSLKQIVLAAGEAQVMLSGNREAGQFWVPEWPQVDHWKSNRTCRPTLRL
jgi:hypothetical protein